MGAWDDIQNKRGTRGGIFFLPADNEEGKPEGGEAYYRVRVVRCLANYSRQGTPQFIIETTVLSSTQPKRPVGSFPSNCIPMNKDAAGGNVADICRAGLASLINSVIAAGGLAALEELCGEMDKWGLDITATMARSNARAGEPVQADAIHLGRPEDKGKAVEFWIGGEENPLGDVELMVTAWNRNTKADPDKGIKSHPFTRLRWDVPTDIEEAARQALAAGTTSRPTYVDRGDPSEDSSQIDDDIVF